MQPASSSGIANGLRLARLARRWTLDDLAARAGVHRVTIYRTEAGRTTPGPGTLRRLVDALDSDALRELVYAHGAGILREQTT